MPYIPSKDADFLDWSRNLIAYTAAHSAEWNIPEGKVTPVQALFDAFQIVYIKAQGPNRGSVDIQKKNEARTALDAVLRGFVNEHLRYNSAVTDDDRRNLGIHIPDKKPTSVPLPATHPDFDIDTSELRRLTVRFRDSGSERRGKPSGVHGAEVRWDYRDTPPASIDDDLKHSEFSTHSPHTLKFDEGDRGKMVYISVCWENTRGKKGPWGEIISAVVP